jgi:hypothetical protein
MHLYKIFKKHEGGVRFYIDFMHQLCIKNAFKKCRVHYDAFKKCRVHYDASIMQRSTGLHVTGLALLMQY